MSCAWCASDNGDHIKPFFHFVKLDHKIAHTDILRNVWRLWCQNRPRKGLVCDLRNTININPKQVKTKNVEFSVYRIAHNPQAVETWKRAEEWLPNSLSATFQFSTLSSFRYITTPLTFLGKSRPKWSIRHPSLKKKAHCLLVLMCAKSLKYRSLMGPTTSANLSMASFIHWRRRQSKPAVINREATAATGVIFSFQSLSAHLTFWSDPHFPLPGMGWTLYVLYIALHH